MGGDSGTCCSPQCRAEARLAVAAVKARGYLGNLLSGMQCPGS